MATKPNGGAQDPEDALGISTIDDLIRSSSSEEEEEASPPSPEPEPKAAETPDGGDEPGTDDGAQAGEEEEVTEPEAQPTAAELQERIDGLTAEMRRSAQKQTPAEGKPEAGEEAEPDFSFNIPGELVKLMESEDVAERRQGLALYAEGIARAAYKTAAAQMQQLQQQRLPAMVQQMLALHDQARAVADDFYGSNPDLNKPELRPFIRETARVVATEIGADSWTPQLKAAVEKRVRMTLGLKKPARPAAPKPPGKTPKGGGGKRPDVTGGTVADDVRNTIL